MSKTVCQIADELTSTDRINQYGHPKINMTEIAAMWSIILRTHVSAEQVALCNIATKICRQMHQSKRGNLIDICGYAKVADKLNDETQNQESQEGQESQVTQAKAAKTSKRKAAVQKQKAG